MTFQGSEAYKNVIGATRQQLINARRYYVIAIDYWTQQNNPVEIQFFQEGLALIDKRIKSLT